MPSPIGSDLRSLTLCCTYAAPGPFCSRMFKLWQDMAPVMGVPTVMRDVTLWAFTQDFFLNQEADAEGIRSGDGGARPCRSRPISRSSTPSRCTTPGRG